MRNANHAILLMLLSLAALNMPQAAVFCIGGDGHMAIEPAGHDHCADGSHPHSRRPTDSETAEHSQVGRPYCRPCIDIPIPVGSGDHRIASQKMKLTPAHAAGLPPAIDMPGGFDALRVAKPSFFSSHASCALLRCVILQI
jgi:hypothetical protein